MEEKLFFKLSQVIKKRKKDLPKNSYVAKLFKKGKVKIANKLGEEAVETITAYLYEGKKELLEESADLIFHLLVLLEDSGLSIEEVEKILEKRMNND
jgi:phosphoribosyl-ATP pyrophosphohydrolase/phosphoribosyl-AMP cyclohydrolase|tara:strand:- start:103 stop:393 length:291 start_codon:yes stop_codon:yes gene_type:complete